MTAPRHVDVLVVGAGPAGLAAAARLAAAGAGRVEVLEREAEPGGVPRHCMRGGFGTWIRPLTGPAYARRLTEAAERAGATVRTRVTALDWAPTGPVLTTVGPGGPETVEARAVVLATGARGTPAHRPAGARHPPRRRLHHRRTPAGGPPVRAAHRHPRGRRRRGGRRLRGGRHRARGRRPGRRPGHGAPAGPDRPRPRARRPGWATASRCSPTPPSPNSSATDGCPASASATATAVRPSRPVTPWCSPATSSPTRELARRGGLTLDPGTRGPAVGATPHTSRPGVFAAGNVLHAVEPAAAAAREGVRAAGAVLDFLAGAPWPDPGVPVTVEAPLRWIAPNRVTPAGPPVRYVLRTEITLPRPTLYVHQGAPPPPPGAARHRAARPHPDPSPPAGTTPRRPRRRGGTGEHRLSAEPPEDERFTSPRTTRAVRRPRRTGRRPRRCPPARPDRA
ncbi:FAD-dependent oxidoreductase [Streptomyces tricolor]|nr:FAD-dependent oxidoreductase [Streptomyces tricolor]